jgi:AhpD family alkylhydroperoxidase
MALKARINHPVAIFPEAMHALQALGKVAHNPAVPRRTLLLVELRASQINGCSVCVDLHARDLKKGGETDERLFAVAAWRDNPAFDDAERAGRSPHAHQRPRGPRLRRDLGGSRAPLRRGRLATLVLDIASINAGIGSTPASARLWARGRDVSA